MSSKLFVLLLVVCLAMAKAADDVNENDEATEKQNDETTEKENDETNEKEETTKEEPKVIMEDTETQTSTALVEQDQDAIKHKGFCHWGIAIWYKPGVSIRCNCMRCTCRPGGNWACAYYFPYCPYYYCGNVLFNPATQLCCCGKVHSKRRFYSCCGYFYYDTRISKCCNYYSVKPKKANCPRYRI